MSPLPGPHILHARSRSMSDVFVSMLLGLIEGFTEFLPISSTAHLLIAEHWLGRQTELFNIAVQAGAILAVTAVYRHRLWVLAAAVFAPERAIHASTDWAQPPRDYLARLAVTFGITAILGLVIKALGWELSHDITPIAWALIFGAVWMLAAEHIGIRRRNQRAEKSTITWGAAILVGIAQVVAGVFPGTSRSAAAIFALLLMGLCTRAAAAEFVFIVGIPTIWGAAAYSLLASLAHQPLTDMPWISIGAGSAAAFVAAMCAVRWLLHFLQTHKFTGFAVYRLAMGVALLVWHASQSP